MNIFPIPAFFDNYIWVIVDEESGVFDCVDPGDAKPVLQFAHANHLKLRAILLTHHHHDHIGGVSELIKTHRSCSVYGPNDPRIPYVTMPLHKDQIIQIGSCHFKIVFNPGHTSTHISYYESRQEWLFCGDTLFSAGCGRVFDGTVEQLHQSLLFLNTLPVTTQIFCAHEYTRDNLRFAQTVEPNNISVQHYAQALQKNPKSCTLPSTLKRERFINPFLRTDQPEVQQYALKHGAKSLDSLELFSVLRKEKNTFN